MATRRKHNSSPPVNHIAVNLPLRAPLHAVALGGFAISAARAFDPDDFRDARERATTAAHGSWLLSPPFLFLLVALVLAVLIPGRDGVVRLLPATGAVYRLAGLSANPLGMEIRGLRARLLREEDRIVLAIEGDIANLRRVIAALPTLRLIVRAADGRDLYASKIRPGRSRLEARETIGFRARLAEPPEAAVEVVAALEAPRAAPRPIASVSRAAKMP